ncbi:glycosyl hydrolase [Ferruginibacter paludis]|uniref:glycosyl hydrolase n=1 Tax=Ferruginibacter paludis TaxID=1310417 RepID=UPI0025B40339|nr:glycosyl hydrolase [Ferruginibacter paludis]MDN3656542.1 glycosyl hydrolase [Ferruginibacter paludis]
MFNTSFFFLNYTKKVLLGASIVLSSAYTFAQQKPVTNNNAFAGYANMEKIFLHPKDAVQTGVYWYWMSGNISKEGVVKDLEAMKKVGINRAFIGNIEQPDVAQGKVKFLSPEWWDVMHTALKTATKLNIEIGIFNSPGWSQSGGPWIKPEQSMRYLASSETNVKGGSHVTIKLKKPTNQFQDVRLIAFPKPKDYDANIADNSPRLTSPSLKNVQAVMDKDTATEVAIPLDSVATINIQTNKDFEARSIVLYPSHRPIIAKIQLQVSAGDSFKTVKEFTIDRSNSALNVGFDPYGRIAVALPATSAKSFRLVISNLKTNYATSWGPAPDSTSGIQELQILSSPKVENYIEKTLAKMSQTPFPLWGQYLWPDQNNTTDKPLAIDPAAVKDISNLMSADGELNWDAPAGEWIIVRSGMAPTGVTNSPAPPNGTGLEVDKMNKDYLAWHFDAFLGEIIKRIPAEDRKTFKIVVQDSYETGGQNWTDNMIGKFKKVYGYDPAPYIPVLYGSVVGSEEMSNRFLWDLRRFIADKVSFEYVGGLREISHKHGLTTWLENYGHWGFPGEFLQYGGQSDEIGGEFWSEGDLGNIENRAASSSAHIYGKTKVSAESFTCGGAAYSRYPAKMKQRGDRFFTEGINNTVMHVYIEQPYNDKLPGVNAGFSNEFNRNNTWFNQMPLFTDYLKRCNFMLQQGRYVADVAYFIGEDAPKMTGVCDPALPKGYSFDYINADVLKERLRVKNGRLVLPNGITYRMLVLPKLTTMRPELLATIQQLVKLGAVVFGPAPKSSPSLQDFATADEQVSKIAKEMWGNIDSTSVKANHYGKGMVISGMDLQEALTMINAAPDCKINGDDSVLFIHRKINNDDVYFLSNQKDKPISFDAALQVKGKQPELWNPVTGAHRLLPAYTIDKNETTISLKLHENESAFIVFRTPVVKTNNKNLKTNFPEQNVITEIKKAWQVSFDASHWGPEKPVTFDTLIDWTKSDNDKIKYYSGTAIYQNNFTIANLKANRRMLLDLGTITAMAAVKINGVKAGGVWTAPYQLDITRYIHQGLNTLEIAVVNTWVNRLIGDLHLPEKERTTWTNVNPYAVDSPLEPSGLLGPVLIKAESK